MNVAVNTKFQCFNGERMTEKEVCDDCKYYRKSDDYCYYRGYEKKKGL